MFSALYRSEGGNNRDDPNAGLLVCEWIEEVNAKAE